MVLTDTGTYPGGVAPTLIGYFIITQPDGVTVTGSFGSPDISWTGSSLSQANKELRLNNSNGFQQGNYQITYWVRETGYTDTMLTKTFNLNYIPPSLSISNTLNEFTPDLSVSDQTSYSQTGFTFISANQSWAANINSVLGTGQNISGNGYTFDLNYQGGYYDSIYTITLTSQPQYQLNSPANWVTIIDKIVLTVVYQAQIPPTLVQLQAGLTLLKQQLDAAVNDCNTYPGLLSNYNLASSIYDNLVRRGQANDLSGLDAYVWQLQTIFNNNVVPTYLNTNGLIPPYNWGSGSGTVSWINITGKPSTILVEWLVGAGGFPGNGATVYTDARLVGIPINQLLVFRNDLPQYAANQSDGNTYFTKVTGNNFITFSQALTTGERIIIYVLGI